jgi:hypothetical protein
MFTRRFAGIGISVFYRSGIALCLLASSGALAWGKMAIGDAGSSQSGGSPAISRHYREGESVGYIMLGSNESPSRSFHYEGRVAGTVSKNPAGIFVEDFAWTGLKVSGQPFALSPESTEFREPLSLAADFALTVPNLSKVQPVLIGPITDLLTFYADVQLAMGQKALVRAGDHIYVKHGSPNSWADGRRVILGQDAIDFDITLESIDKTNGIANLIVRHLPPPEMHVKLPSAWMMKPIATSPNNWVQIEKESSGKFIAGVGDETFEAHIELALATGRIISAAMDNPVEVVERTCEDANLTNCDDETHYRIRRQISIEADPPSKPVSATSR